MEADGVFAGGGVKGLGFAGAIKAAEEVGYDEWRKLAGTSAGAITAMALAVGYDADGLDKMFETLKLDRIADYGPLGKSNGREPDRPRRLTRGVALHKWLEELVAGARPG